MACPPSLHPSTPAPSPPIPPERSPPNSPELSSTCLPHSPPNSSPPNSSPPRGSGRGRGSRHGSRGSRPGGRGSTRGGRKTTPRDHHPARRDQNPEEKEEEWSSNLTSMRVEPFTTLTGPTVPISANPTEMFLSFFTSQLINHIVIETNRYAAACLTALHKGGWPSS